MARIDIKSAGATLSDGVLQLENGVAMDTTLRNVADQNNTTSPLKLSTTAVQVVSPLRITTDDPSDMYLDCEDGATNNRFNITRNTASQQVNLNFASNPAGSTTIVGAIRTYVDGVNLSEVMSFREDGIIGIGTNAPTRTLDINASQAILKVNSTTTTNSAGILATNTSTGRDFWFGRDSSVGNGFGMSSPAYAGVINARGAYPLYIGANDLNILSLLADGKVGINQTAPTAQLQVKGSGSTSATTSLLVQNSAGSTALQITDDRTTTTSGTLTNITTTAALVNGLGLTASSMGGYTGVGIYRSGGGEGQIDITHYNANTSNGLTIREFFGTGQSLYTLATKFELRILGGFTSPNGNNTVGNTLWMEPIYNITSGTGTIVRGIYYNPTLTSLVNTTHYGIQTTSGGAYINTNTPQASACLQADSTTQGFLPPRMTNAQRAAITTPAIGLMVYCTDAVEGIYVYKSTGWTFVA